MAQIYSEDTLDKLNSANSSLDLIQAINWDEVWSNCEDSRFYQAQGRRRVRPEYVYAIDKAVVAKSGMSVLIPKANGGAITIPMALAGARVTIVNDDTQALERIKKRAKEEWVRPGLISYVEAGFDDDWAKAGVGPHSVVILSRAVIRGSLKKTIEKLCEYASKRVVMTVELYRECPAGECEHAQSRCTNHITILNQVLALGYEPSLNYIEEDDGTRYAMLAWSVE